MRSIKEIIVDFVWLVVIVATFTGCGQHPIGPAPPPNVTPLPIPGPAPGPGPYVPPYNPIPLPTSDYGFSAVVPAAVATMAAQDVVDFAALAESYASAIREDGTYEEPKLATTADIGSRWSYSVGYMFSGRTNAVSPQLSSAMAAALATLDEGKDEALPLDATRRAKAADIYTALAAALRQR